MNLDQFIAKYSGQSVLWAPSAARENLRGQCVQLVCFYVNDVWGLPVIWDDAYGWFVDGRLADKYSRIANDHNDPNQLPPRGAVIIWGPGTPGSAGLGHIAVVVSALPGSPTFVSFDSNWGGKTAHLVTHNWSNVVGWIVPAGGKGAEAPAPAPAPQPAPTGGDEMIVNADQATKIYKMLRPNGGANQDEINVTVGKRSFANFLNDAQNEVNQRDANLRAQEQRAADLQNTIDALNRTITNVQTEGINSKQQLDAAVTRIAQLTTDLTDAHDRLKELQNKVVKTPETTTPKVEEPNLIVKVIAAFLKRKKS